MQPCNIYEFQHVLYTKHNTITQQSINHDPCVSGNQGFPTAQNININFQKEQKINTRALRVYKIVQVNLMKIYLGKLRNLFCRSIKFSSHKKTAKTQLQLTYQASLINTNAT